MPSLTILSGPAAGQFHAFTDRVLMGRDPDVADLVLDDGRASRRHAEIVRRGKVYVLRDLGSRNCTLLDDRPVGETVLKDGDRVTIGQSQILFLEGKGSDRPASSPRAPTLVAQTPKTQIGDGSPDSDTVEISAEASPTTEAQDVADLDSAHIVNKHLNIVLEVSTALSTASNLSEIFDSIMRKLLDALPTADRAFLMLFDEQTGELTPRAARTRAGGATGDVHLSRTIINKAVGEKRAILCRDTRLDEYSSSASIVAQSIRMFMCCPLIYHDKTLGVLQVDTRRTGTPFSQDDLKLLRSLASQVALAIQNARESHHRQLLYLENMSALVKAIEARDEYTRGHSIRVAEYSLIMARRLNSDRLPDERIGLPRLRCAGQLHDVGKINVPQAVLHKPGELTEEEMAQMRRHPMVSYFILSGMRLPADIMGIATIAALHHERVDGQGYPCGLAGDDIPIEARIIAAADAFDAMTSDRPYRGAVSPAEAADEIRRVAGTQLDPEVSAVFSELYEAGVFRHVLGAYSVGPLADLPNREEFVAIITKLIEDPSSAGWRPEPY